MTSTYVFGADEDLAHEQLQILSALWDDYSERMLDGIGIPDGARCLDIGPGIGSTTRMLAQRSGASGTTTAVDIDTEHAFAAGLADVPRVDVIEHDINDGVPEGGPFDVVHARLVLMHLPQRERILGELVDALRPGGWLVIADNGHLPRIISAPQDEDIRVFDRFQELAEANATRRGLSFEWALEIDRHMTTIGLENVHGTHLTHAGDGGSMEARLSHNYARQMETSLLNAGIPAHDVHLYRDMWLDPAYRFWFYAFACWAGRRA